MLADLIYPLASLKALVASVTSVVLKDFSSAHSVAYLP